jgi:hypothetical protein
VGKIEPMRKDAEVCDCLAENAGTKYGERNHHGSNLQEDSTHERGRFRAKYRWPGWDAPAARSCVLEASVVAAANFRLSESIERAVGVARMRV